MYYFRGSMYRKVLDPALKYREKMAILTKRGAGRND
jgi:hypothetical protein